VTGLGGTGGKTPITREFATNFLQNYGMRLDAVQRLALRTDTTQKTDNLSVVTVIAELPPFARNGQRIDVLVSAFDDAKSLQGGTLLLTPLYGADSGVYAVAAGPLSVGGFSFSGDAASVRLNHPTTARIANGATVECEVPFQLASEGLVRLLLRRPDFVSAQRIADQINHAFPGTALASDATRIEVLVPDSLSTDLVGFVGAIQRLPVTPDTVARVVINERTGTVVVGEHVRISRVALTHANLSVITAEAPVVSQPEPFSEGTTTVVPRTQLDVVEGRRPMQVFEDSVTVGDLAAALNALGVTPRDLSSIFQQLHASGALHAELVMN
jgi:flagellar P-ring protein precursor FlgI